MVFINSQKFACESCIKGHRSSSCAHTDRPLYEIKKKGRPVSQCERCRQLRSTKRVHSKCTCSEGPPRARESEKAFGTKQKRYIPIVPALPNGLKDAFPSSSNSAPSWPSNPRQKVDALLNPCRCEDVWNCCCGTSSVIVSPAEEFDSESSTGPIDGLETLARAAAMFHDQEVIPGTSKEDITTSNASASSSSHPRKHDRIPTPGPSPRPSHKRVKPVAAPTPGPDLPPILFQPLSTSYSAPYSSPPHYAFSPPPFSTLNLLAGSGCTCGLRCACPDCAEHHSNERTDCGDACQNCVDDTLREVDLSAVGFAKWTTTSSSVDRRAGEGSAAGARAMSRMDHFLAIAAQVPAPPAVGGAPVALPKLCCGGSCGCGGACGCGKSCDGCCADRSEEAEPAVEEETLSEPPATVEMSEEAPATKSCCC